MRFLRLLSTVGVCLAVPAFAADALLDGFVTPPQSARPQVWWHWMGGNVTLEGARLDLEWMKRVGVGGVHTFAGGGLFEPHVVDPPVPFMSDTWKAIFRDTTAMARAAGMDVTIAGSPGWSETGGVWVTPEHGMKKYVWTELEVEGGRVFKGVLPRPPATTGPFLGVKGSHFGAPPKELTGDLYRDALVIAFPTPRAESAVGHPTWTGNVGPLDLTPLLAGDLSRSIELLFTAGTSKGWVQAQYNRDTTLAALELGLKSPADVQIEVADRPEGPFRTLVSAKADTAEYPSPQRTYAFPPTRGRVFRIALAAPPAKPLLPDLPPMLNRAPESPHGFSISRLALLGAARVDHFESRAGFQSTPVDSGQPTAAAAADAVIPAQRVIDLTSHLQANGTLRWKVPAGRWTVLRLGWSLTGQTNGPAEPEDTGLEVDKLDAEQVRAYLNQYLALYESAMQAPLGARSVGSLLTDSWEAGVQNWTPTLLQQFRARRGYDPLPYVPALTGHVVNSTDASERFLWDFRLTLKEILADNHYGVLADVLHSRGMNYYTESQGDTPRAIADGMTNKARSDIPTAEFWYRPFATAAGQPSLVADLEEAASAAHVYGRKLAAAESLTVAAGSDPWAFAPGMLKPVADEIFAHGINRILIHESHHQPRVSAAPGLELGFFGQFFNRNDTWAEDAGPWVSYLARTSYLLQQGQPVADVAYFYGEEKSLTERYQHTFNHDVPTGYAYDYVNPEALLKLLTVRDGQLVTPGGMRYRVLYIPSDVTRVTLPVLQKLGELVKAGAIIVGRRPIGGLGLSSPDIEVSSLADAIWKNPGVYGAGDLSAALRDLKLPPDVAVEGSDGVLNVHRHLDDAEVYFVSNVHGAPRDLNITFRVQGRLPEIWHAEDGTVEPVSYMQTQAGTRVSLHLNADETVFVVFGKSASAAQSSVPVRHLSTLDRLDGPWTVTFQTGRGAPDKVVWDKLTDWSQSSEPGTRYFSGAATYERDLVVSKAWLGSGRRVLLDLGDVRELALVSIDGKALPLAWHAPYQVDLTPLLQPGKHHLAVKVMNLWVNRLIGDRQPGAQPITFAPQSPYKAESPLRPSGLLGPVRILARD